MTSVVVCGEVERIVELAVGQGPLGSLLALSVPSPGADHATVTGIDGVFHASVPLEWLVTGMLIDGRLHIPDAPTRCWSVKDVVRIELTKGAREDSVRPESFTTRPQ